MKLCNVLNSKSKTFVRKILPTIIQLGLKKTHNKNLHYILPNSNSFNRLACQFVSSMTLLQKQMLYQKSSLNASLWFLGPFLPLGRNMYIDYFSHRQCSPTPHICFFSLPNFVENKDFIQSFWLHPLILYNCLHFLYVGGTSNLPEIP